MNYRTPLFLLSLLFLGTLAFGVEDVIGEIAYIQGSATIRRNTSQVRGPIDIGFQIQNYDMIQVGSNGLVEISLRSATGYSSRISLRGGTTMYFDLTSLQSSQQGNLNLLRGSVAVRVDRMNRNSRLNVRTGTATMGVRGTVFEVYAAPGGEILVTTSEGRVSVETESGDTFFTEPGRVVQQVDGRWSQIPIAVSDLETFQRTWNTERIQALRANFPRAMQQYATRYIELRDQFVSAYAGLMDNRAIIQKWIQEDRENRLGTRMEQLREKRQIVGDLLDVRRVLFQWERIYYRVLELEEYFYETNPGAGVISQGMTFRSFFSQIGAERTTLDARMQEVRYINKLYALRNEGRSPLDMF